MRKPFLFILLISFVLLFAYCGQQKKQVAKEPEWLNWSDSAQYVGMNTCKQCHQSIYETFTKTGMGESWGIATKQKSLAKFDAHAIVYDKFKDFYYRPYWKSDSLYIMEFRLKGKDTTYKRIEQVNYIVGSGHHTNSHIWNENGFLHQAPITFYTQQGIWDLAPGFEDGENSRWGRIISLECMSCHNMYPTFDKGSENKFITVKQGIECERCHGPGSLHVAQKEKGIIVDTSKYADRTIVNPRRLPIDLQVELCQRCHMQGISVLNEGKSFFDFKPGMKLNEVMNVFMPRYKGGDDKFIMASHADRMKQSQCFIQSGKMSCLTCHNPHVSVSFTAPEIFNSKCINCHTNTSTISTAAVGRLTNSNKVVGENNNNGGGTATSVQGHACTAPMSARKLKGDNCYGCHMPVSGSIDIPHVTVHDHRIQIPISEKDKQGIQQFVGLECMTTKKPSPLLKAQGYLSTYESYVAKPFLLDSAFLFLNSIKDKNTTAVKKEFVRYYFLLKDYGAEILWVNKFNSNDTLDAWTNYRAGEGCFNTGDVKTAKSYFSKAVKQKPDVPDFSNKLAIAYLYNNQADSAKIIFERILNQDPKNAAALSNLAYLYMLKGDMTYATTLIDKSLALDPDYVEALMNKVALLMSEQKKTDALALARRVLELEPANEKAKLVVNKLRTTM